MIETAPKRKCAGEILRLLKDHSPVTIDMLHKMTEPPIPKKNLRQSLGILRRKGIIDMVVGTNKAFFYQIHQDLPTRRHVANALDCTSNDISRPLLRRQDWFHNQWCEFWSLVLKRAFPEAEIVREHAIICHEIAREALLVDVQDADVIPDFLAIFPKGEAKERTTIAFEIERTRKSDARIAKKLKKYLAETSIDGLVYICDTGRLSEAIRLLYQRSLLAKSHRVKHYADNFFLFSDTMSAGARPLERFFNARAEPVSLGNWCNQLRAVKRSLRRDAQF